MYGYDRKVDIAVLTVTPNRISELEPITIGKSTAVDPGEPVFAIGYPFEGGSESPIVQISSGILSARRPSPLADFEYLQTDAGLSFGSSGGALVDARGRYIGMPTLSLSLPAATGLAVTIEDVAQYVRTILDGKGELEPIDGGSQIALDDQLDRRSDPKGYRIDLKKGQHLQVFLTTEQDLSLLLLDSLGLDTYAEEDSFEDAQGRLVKSLEYDVVDYGSYTLLVSGDAPDASYHLLSPLETSDGHMTRFKDPEDDDALMLNGTLIGELQFPEDRDTFRIELPRGGPVSIRLQSWQFDGYLAVRRSGDETDLEADDNSGRGLLGVDPLIDFIPQEPGVYEVTVSAGAGHGFYQLRMKNP